MIDPQLTGKTVLITRRQPRHRRGYGARLRRTGRKGLYHLLSGAVPTPEEELAAARVSAPAGRAITKPCSSSPPSMCSPRSAAAGGVAWLKEADLSDPANIPLLFDRCEAELGPVAVLVNNHTYCVLETFDPALEREEGFPLHMVAPGVIDAHFAINARGGLAHGGVRAALPGRRRLLGASSTSAPTPRMRTRRTSAAASKHAIESYSRSAAVELGKYGITVNVVAPGPVQTGYITPEDEAAIAAGTPLGRRASRRTSPA